MPSNLSIVIDKPSNSARDVAKGLGVLRVHPEKIVALAARYPRRVFLNWGCDLSRLRAPAGRVLNARSWVATNKLSTFDAISAICTNEEVRIPEYTTNKAEAKRWLDGGAIVLARRTVTGSGGAGITVLRPGTGDVPNAVVYVKYIKKDKEYRVHVVNNRSIFIQEKRKKNEVQQTEDQKLIRNHDNGWVFCENAVDAPEAVVSTAVHASSALGLYFAAIDLVVEKRTGNVYFLEANSRPGLESTRLKEAYVQAFRGA